MLALKRVYEPAAPGDGYRILTDRLWPRGLTKEKAGVDLWMKEVAPTGELRKWFAHDVEKWPEFRTRYLAELKDNPAAGELLRVLKEHKKVTLLFGSRDGEHNQAVVLRDFIQEHARG